MPLNRNIYLILLSRSLRTFPYGFLSVVLPLYLASIGSSLVVGSFFSISVISSLVLLAALSFLGNRVRIRSVIILQMVLFALCMVILTQSTMTALLLLAASISVTNWAPGGGSGSGSGPYNTALNLMLSENCDSRSRTLAISLGSVTGTLSFAAGAYFLDLIKLPTTPEFVPLTLSSFATDSVSFLFILSGVLQLAATVLLLPVPARHLQGAAPRSRSPVANSTDLRATASSSSPLSSSSSETAVAKGAGQARLGAALRQASRFVSAEFSNGFANGLFQRYMPLWFYLRFQISLNTLGQIFAISGVITALLILLSPKIERLLGAVNSIFYGRTGFAVLLVFMAYVPSFNAALLIYYISLVFARVAAPIQQSLVFATIDKENWTRVTGMIGMANSVGGIISPILGAFLLLDVNVVLPLVVAFPFIVASALIYKVGFRGRQKDSNLNGTPAPAATE